MSLVVRDDRERVGHAILELDSVRVAPLSVSLQFPDRTYLGPEGHRGRGRHLFPAEAMDADGTRFRLGPDVTAHVRESEIVSVADSEGLALGTVGWDGIRAPLARGGGLSLSGDARQGARQGGTGSPVLPKTEPVVAASSPPLQAMPEASTPSVTEAGPPARSSAARKLGLPIAACVGFATLAYIVALFAGVIGWRLQPTTIAFEGPPGGPFRPVVAEAKFERTGGAALLSSLFGSASPVTTDDIPAWLNVHATRAGDAWRVDLAMNPAETAGLSSGRIEAAVPLAFPLRTHVSGLVVALTIVQAHVPTPAPHGAVAGPDDALCDKIAGNRFDPDHPAGVPAQDEIFKLAPEQSEAGLAACDPREDRAGGERRFLVQRGRLLAERALRRLGGGDVAGATTDMDAAVAAWRRGDAAGSAYAANLLGAYYKGTFNRPAHMFTTPDDGVAVAHWREGMRRGSLVAQTNFAAELLSGHGVAADPARALELLRDALAKNEPHAGGVLGVALYTGSPQGVSLDKSAGWPLVVAAQCLDRNARALVEAEVQRGAKPAADRDSCPP